MENSAITLISEYPYMNESVEKHSCTDLIFDFNRRISFSSNSSVLETNYG